MRPSDDTLLLDAAVARLAARQDDLFSLAQIVELGGTKDQAKRRVKADRWRRIHPGVYTLTHGRLTWRQRLRAALLAAGPDAAASHESAARLHNVRRSDRIHITAPARRRLKGVTCHTSRNAPATTVVEGLRTTTIERTLLDLATTLDRHQLQKAIHEADFHRLLHLPRLNAITTKPHRGARPLREALADYQPDATDTDEGAAEELLRLIARTGLPRPRIKAMVAGWEADFYWPEHRLVVEVDGRQAHLNHHAFERDRRRDTDMTAAGVRVVRLTGRRIRREPAAVEGLLRSLTCCSG